MSRRVSSNTSSFSMLNKDYIKSKKQHDISSTMAQLDRQAMITNTLNRNIGIETDT